MNFIYKAFNILWYVAVFSLHKFLCKSVVDTVNENTCLFPMSSWMLDLYENSRRVVFFIVNVCIGDDTTAAARQSLNWTKNKKK